MDGLTEIYELFNLGPEYIREAARKACNNILQYPAKINYLLKIRDIMIV